MLQRNRGEAGKAVGVRGTELGQLFVLRLDRAARSSRSIAYQNGLMLRTSMSILLVHLGETPSP